MASEIRSVFSKWRAFFWPIERSELKKFVPMLLIFFLIAFSYNLLRTFKDSLIVTAPESGAEAIPFIKFWLIVPSAIAFTFLFTRLTNRYKLEKVFYIMLGIFLTFFIVFAFFIYPAKDSLHLHTQANNLQALLPEGCKGLVSLLRNWTFALFYVMSDLFGTMILTVLFWGFANEVTKVNQAKRFYGLLAIGANSATILSGQAAIFFCNQSFISWIPYGKEVWDQSLLFVNCTVIICCALIIGLLRWLSKHALTPEEQQARRFDASRPKMSMRKNFSTLAKSRYLLLIALIVLSYNLGMNLIEVVWKNQVKALYPNPISYNAYMGQVMTLTGTIALATSFFLSPILRRCSWTTSALIPPLVTFLTGGLFFAFACTSHMSIWGTGLLLGLSPLALSATFGSMQNCMARASKFTLFDATKELAYIPLDRDTKLKGKAAIDGIGSRLGKSGGSLIHQSFFLFFGSLAASAPYIGIIFIAISAVWIFSVSALGKRFDQITSQETETNEPTLSTN